MTPNPNPRPENDLSPWGYAPGGYIFTCRDCPADISVRDKMERAGAKRSFRCREHALIAQEAARQTAHVASILTPPPTPAETVTVALPGAGEFIDRGKLKQATDDLIVAVRSSWGIGSAEHNLVRDICDLIDRAPGASLATVTAANGEGVAEAAKVADDYAVEFKGKADCARDTEERRIFEAHHFAGKNLAAAIRLLPQGGGK